MIPVRRASSTPQTHHDFDALAAAARVAIRDHYAPHHALNAYLATLRVAALATDDAGCYIAANELASRLTGYEVEELLTVSVPDITAREDEADGAGVGQVDVDCGHGWGAIVERIRPFGPSARHVYDCPQRRHVSPRDLSRVREPGGGRPSVVSAAGRSRHVEGVSGADAHPAAGAHHSACGAHRLRFRPRSLGPPESLGRLDGRPDASC